MAFGTLVQEHWDDRNVGLPRSGFLRAAVPIHLEGLTGPGAPHHLEIVRRTDSGSDVMSLYSYHS